MQERGLPAVHLRGSELALNAATVDNLRVLVTRIWLANRSSLTNVGERRLVDQTRAR